MQLETIWKWLDAVDEDHLDPLVQWSVQSPGLPHRDTSAGPDNLYRATDGEKYQQYNHKYNAEVAGILKSVPPSGILLRNGSIRNTGKDPKALAHDVENFDHPQSLIPGFAADELRGLNPPQFSAPTTPESISQRANTPSTRQLQTSGRECNDVSTKSKRLPPPSQRPRLQSIPTIRVEVRDPVALNCQGARVVGGFQQTGLQSLPSMKEKERRHTTAEGGALHRSNAVRKNSHVRVEPKARGRRSGLGQ